jgi:hypothetical protein
MIYWLIGLILLGYNTAFVFTYLCIKISPQGINIESNPLLRVCFKKLGPWLTNILCNISWLLMLGVIYITYIRISDIGILIGLGVFVPVFWFMAIHDYFMYRKIRIHRMQ